jgi:hypothetical protein
MECDGETHGFVAEGCAVGGGVGFWCEDRETHIGGVDNCTIRSHNCAFMVKESENCVDDFDLMFGEHDVEPLLLLL